MPSLNILIVWVQKVSKFIDETVCLFQLFLQNCVYNKNHLKTCLLGLKKKRNNGVSIKSKVIHVHVKMVQLLMKWLQSLL